MTNIGGEPSTSATRHPALWDEQDEFYYDELNLPDGRMVKLKVRSMVGLIPLFAVETLSRDARPTAGVPTAAGMVPRSPARSGEPW